MFGVLLVSSLVVAAACFVVPALNAMHYKKVEESEDTADEHVDEPVVKSHVQMEYCYVTAGNGKKYHASETCRSLSRSAKVYKTSINAVKQRGFSPCSLCYGDRLLNQ